METLTTNSTDGNDYILAEAECYLGNIPLPGGGGRFFLDNYTLHELNGSNLEVAMEAQKNGLLSALEIPTEDIPDFITFGRKFFPTMTYGQIAALYHASRSKGQYVLVSSCRLVAEAAQSLSVQVIQIDGAALQPLSHPNAYPPVFRNEVDEAKVFATLREIREKKDSPLKDKSYWVVPIYIFKKCKWICCTNLKFIERVNQVFHLDPLLKEGDIKYGTRQIKSKAESLDDWADNPYRDFAYRIYDVFLGKEEPWGGSGLYVYSHEKNFTKENIEIPHRRT